MKNRFEESKHCRNLSGCIALTHTDKMSITIALTLSIFTQRKLKDPKISEEWECFTQIQRT